MKTNTLFRCSNCNYTNAKWLGRCPECSSWNTLTEETVKTTNIKNKISSGKSAKKLNDIVVDNKNRIITGINEFDRVMGGGIVRDSISIITARPGAGKSTILLQIANQIAKSGLKVVYASGEESESQIKNRADRILENINENIWILQETNLDNVLVSVNEVNPDLLIIDSIQTFTIESAMPSRAGSPTQTMECANALLQVAKNEKNPKAVILVGQMTKNDELAGLRALEHLVDTVLILDDDNDETIRVLSASKNRFGGIENGFFQMDETGLTSIDNPSEFFMTKREEGEIVSGSALTVIKEGTRAIITEIESLVSKSFTAYPTRIGEAFGKDKLNTLISVLEQRGNINLYDKNVIMKTTGGIKLKEQGINLAIIMSIVSSVKKQGIPSNIAFIADVGLTGELKKVPALENRIKELERMGFKKVYVSKNSFAKTVSFKEIKVIELKTLKDVITDIYK